MSTDIMDVTLSEVESAMSNAGVNLMIHGHTHRPATHALMVNEKQATRIVLGDWDASGWYIKAGPSGGSPELVSFKLTGD
jgi:UDP-2,3-diacylglucosamine hydrolase